MEDESEWSKRAGILKEVAVSAFEIEDPFQLLADAATKMALAVCGQPVQFVILKLFRLGESESLDAYQIIFGMPMDSVRHGQGDVGRLFEPTPKIALLQAIEEKKIVIANKAQENKLTDYMQDHAVRKDIAHVAIVPVENADNEIGWLFVFDRVDGSAEFNTDDQIFLERCAEIASASIRRHYNDIRERKKSAPLKSAVLLTSLEDIIGNRDSSIGLFMERSKKAKEKGDTSTAEYYMTMAFQNLNQMHRDLGLMNDVRKFLQHGLEAEKEKKLLSEYLLIFASEPFILKSGSAPSHLFLNHSEKLVGGLFTWIREYMLGNMEIDEKLEIDFFHKPIQKEVDLLFSCSGFQPYKTVIDPRISRISSITEILDGVIRVEENRLRITLPVM
ncbi:MAG: GAF domain-containing protein [Parcubacteria group bacterium]|jgi:hypothetical protein